MSDPVNHINGFLREAIFRKDGPAIHKIYLRSAAPGKKKGTPIDEFDLPEEINVDSLRALAEQIAGRAKMDADGMGGTIRYVLLVSAEGENEPIRRLPFRVRGESDDEDGEEAPNEKGLTTQLMRHLEARERNLNTMYNATLVAMARRMDSQDKQLDKLMAERLSVFELIEKLTSKEHERNVAMVGEVAKQERYKELFDKISILFPVVVNRLVGKKVLAADEPFAATVRALAESLTPDQFTQLQGVLTVEQSIALINVIKEAQDSEERLKKAREAENKRLTPGSNGTSKPTETPQS